MIGLKIYVNKTRIIYINKMINSARIVQVHSCRYLGAVEDEKMDCKSEIKIRRIIIRLVFI